VSCAKTGGPILTIYTSYDVFLRKEFPFGSFLLGVAMIAHALTSLVRGVIF